MRPLVVDASAALAFVVGEPGGERVQAAMQGRTDLVVPWLFWSEVIDSLARRHRWPGSQVLAAVYDLEQIGLRSEHPTREARLAVIDAVERHGLTAYDAEYLVLAEAVDGDILTGDARLARAAGDHAIVIGSGHRLAETDAPYSQQPEQPDWPSWTGAADYMVQLRREARADLEALRSTS